MADPAPYLRLCDVVKSYDGRSNAVDDVSLDIARGEFVTLLGPSGSGKTTTLTMIAGFETPTRGAIMLDGHDLIAPAAVCSATSAWCSRTTRCFRT